MKKGISLLLWTPFVEPRHLPILAELKAMGYDGVEVPVAAGDDDAHYTWLGAELSKLGLEATAVGFLKVDEDPASADAATRARAVQRLGYLARRAQALGAEILAGRSTRLTRISQGRFSPRSSRALPRACPRVLTWLPMRVCAF